MRNKSLGDPAFSLQLRQFLRTAGSIVKRNVCQIAQVHALTRIQRKSIIACQAGTVRILTLAEHLDGRTSPIAQRKASEAGSAGASRVV
jgi:hypothetical protein